MPQNLLVNNFDRRGDTSIFNEYFLQNYNEESDEEYFLEVDVQYLQKLDKLQNNLPFLPERIKIEIVKKLVSSFHDKNEYAIHIRNLMQALNQELVLEKSS